jgi:hypothetical protein
MPAASLASKLNLKPGLQAAVINAASGYLQSFSPLPQDVTLGENLEDMYDWILGIVRARSELESLVALILAALHLQSLLWITFLKGSS